MHMRGRWRRSGGGPKGNSHNLQQHFVCIVTINLKCAGQDRSFEPTSSTACQLKWKWLSFRCNKSGCLGGVGVGGAVRQPGEEAATWSTWAAPAHAALGVPASAFSCWFLSHLNFDPICLATQFRQLSRDLPLAWPGLAGCRLSASRIALAGGTVGQVRCALRQVFINLQATALAAVAFLCSFFRATLSHCASSLH